MYSHLSRVACNGTPSPQRLCAMLGEIEIVILLLGAFLRAVCYGCCQSLCTSHYGSKVCGLRRIIAESRVDGSFMVPEGNPVAHSQDGG